MHYFKSLLISSLLATSLSAQLVGGVSILVKDEPITIYDIKSLMQKENITQKEASEYLIRQKLEELEIKKRNLTVTNDEVYKHIEMMAQQNRMSVSELYEAMLNARKLTQKELKEKIKESKLKEKLYNAIAFSTIEQPSEEDELEYYNLHKKRYTTHEKYNITVYTSENKNSLQKKLANPMLYLQDVLSNNDTLEAKKIDPRLAQLLESTEQSTFSQIVPSPNGGFMSFYVSEKIGEKLQEFSLIRDDVRNAIMQELRGQVLNDYFTRLRLNTEIKTYRKVK